MKTAAARVIATMAGALALVLLPAGAAHAAASGACAGTAVTVTVSAGPGPDTILAQPTQVVVNGTPTTCVGDPTSLTIVNPDDSANDIQFTGSATYPVTANLAGGADTFTATGAQALTVDGGAAIDTITGGSGGDVITGAGGGDTIDGGAGADTINGGIGNDILDGGPGAGDQVFGDADNDTIRGGAADGVDTVDGGTGADDRLTYGGELGPGPGVTIHLGDGVPTGTDNAEGFENATGSQGDDEIFGSGAVNEIDGAGGDDTIHAVAGDPSDMVDGGPGTDTLSYEDELGPGPGVTIRLGSTVAPGTDDAENFENAIGSDGDDTIFGSSAVNDIDAAGGNDTVHAGAADAVDIVDGGPGADDLLTYAGELGPGPGVTIRLGTTVAPETDDAEGFENAIGSEGNDTIYGSSAVNEISGAGGDDTIHAGADDASDVVDGGLGTEDTLTYAGEPAPGPGSLGVTIRLGDGVAPGTDDAEGFENATGSMGDDTIVGSPAANDIDGGVGDDTITGGGGDDVVNGGDGADTIDGGAGVDIIHGDAGDDILTGGADAGDQVFGDADDDTIRGGASDGIDILDGGPGAEDRLTYAGELGPGPGVTIRLGTAVAAGTDDAENFENATGSEGDDTIYGSSDVNEIDAAGGDDTVHAGAGDASDTIDGGPGTDTITYAGDPAPGPGDTGVTIRLGTTVAPGTDDAEGFENAVGSEGDDTIFGSSAVNQIDGSDGDDTITGDDGADVIDGGDGDDTIDGQGGADTIDGGAGVDIINGGAGDDILDGGADPGDQVFGDGDNDTIRGGASDGVDIVDGGAGTEDTLTYSGELGPGPGVTIRLGDGVAPETDDAEGFENAVGSEGDDEIYGSSVVNEIDGAGGDDTIHAGAADAADDVDGGPGTDTLTYAGELGPGPGVTIRLGTGVAAGTDDAENFENAVGSEGDDEIFGSPAVNDIDGAGGDDTIHAGAGDASDTVDGGAGTDTLTYAGEPGPGPGTTGVTIRLGTGVTPGTDDAENFENAVGSEDDDTIYGSSAVNDIDGAGGDDVIHAGANDASDTVDGGAGSDTLTYAGEPAPGPDTDGVTIRLGSGVSPGTDDAENFENAVGSMGDDLIVGSPAVNQIDGGAGDDTITGGDGADVINGGDGADTIDGGAGADIIHGNDGDDILDGGADAGDQVFGDADDDTIRGGATDGVDFVDGGLGADDRLTYAGELGPGPGVTIRLGTAVMPGTDDAENFENATGSEGDDEIFGSSAVNEIDGAGGNDTIHAVAGDAPDSVDGGSGTDTLTYAGELGPGPGVTIRLGTSVAPGSDDAENFENAIGSEGDDEIFGSPAVNDIDGAGGNDTIHAGAGDASDTVDGGAGSDTLSYAGEPGPGPGSAGVTILLGSGVAPGTDDAENFENAVGSEGDDEIFGSSAVNHIDGAGGDDTIHAGAGDASDTVIGGAGTDTLTYAGEPAPGPGSAGVTIRLGTGVAPGTDDAEGFENAVGSQGDDEIFGSGAVNDMQGAGGDDTIHPGAGDASDTAIGGTGTDTLSYAGEAAPGPGSQGVTIRLGDGVAPGTDDAEGFENAVGSEGDDEIFGSSAVNDIDGAGGNDIVHADSADGADIVDGGPGSDTLTYAGEPAPGPGSTGATIRLGSGVAPGTDDAENFENAVGTEGDDQIFGSAAVNVIDGAGGDDTIHPSGGADVVDGGAGTDTISYAGEPGPGVTIRLGDGVIPGSDDAEGFENAVGSEGNDTIIGSSAVNDISGAGGDDTITGGAGADVLDGDAGVDTIDGEADADIIHGGPGNDILSGGAGAGDQVFGDADNDTIRGGAGDGVDFVDGGPGTADRLTYAGEPAPGPGSAGVTIRLGDIVAPGTDDAEGFENATGSEGDDTIFGSNAANDISGGGGVDTIDGDAGADTIHGDAGDDILTGGAGAGDQVFGDADNDTIRGGASDGVDFVDGGPGADDRLTYAGELGPGPGVTIRLGTGVGPGTDDAENFENATGSEGDDEIFGGSAVNEIDGAGGNDAIHAGAGDGSDTVQGGPGIDTLTYAGEPAPGPGTTGVTVRLGTGVAPGSDDAEGFENAVGSEGGDTIFGSSAVNVIDGAGGNDAIHAGAGDASDTVDGGAGTDTLTYAGELGPGPGVTIRLGTAVAPGTDDAENFENAVGSEGNDTIVGSGAVNDISGAGGADAITAGDGNDIVGGGGGVDTIDGQGGADTIHGDAGNDILTGGADAGDQVFGDADDDTIRGGASDGVDIVAGGTGTDTLTYEGESGDVVVNESAAPTPVGTDTASEFENVVGGTGNDTIIGNATNNVLTGGPGNDDLRGGDGIDTLRGEAGDDVLQGDGGADLLEGGSDLNDTASFVERSTPVTASVAGGVPGEDTFTGIENLIGGSAGDTLSGDANVNRLEGRAGNDVLQGRGANDILDGGVDSDTASYADRTAIEPVVASIPAASGGMLPEQDAYTSIEHLAGGAGNDTLTADATLRSDLAGNDGSDTLNGGAGENNLSGGAGNDLLRPDLGGGANDGGPGADTVTYSTLATPLAATLAVSPGTATSTGLSQTLVAVENLTGGSADDTLTGSGDANELSGGPGADTIGGGGGADAIDGGDGPDTLAGGAGDDSLEGFAGDDNLTGDEGADVLTGGPDTDTVSYTAKTARVVVTLDGIANDGTTAPTEGDNVVSTENVLGGSAGDRLVGDQAPNVLRGGPGDDEFVGAGNNDTIDGGNADTPALDAPGRDTASYEDHTADNPVGVSLAGAQPGGGGREELDLLRSIEVLRGGAGPDTLSGGEGDDGLIGGPGGDTLSGNGGNDALTGEDGNDNLAGGGGADSAVGGAGADRIDGGLGADVLAGEAGDDDIFAFDGVTDIITCGEGSDRLDYDRFDQLTGGDCELIRIPGEIPAAVDAGPDPVRDRDSDGSLGPAGGPDCDDLDPAIRPGAPEIPGNAIDENCDGQDAPFPQITTDLRFSGGARGKGLRLKLLLLTRIPASSKIEVLCSSKRSPKCLFKTKTRTTGARPTARLSLRGLLGDRTISVGTVLEVRVTAPNAIGKAFKLTLNKPPKKTTLCIPPGAKTPVKC